MTTPTSPDRSEIRAGAVTLVRIDRELARAILIARAPDGARWADDYPTDGSLACAAAVVAASEAGRTSPFGAYCIVRRDTHLTIGDTLFHGPPDNRGTVDIGYGLVASARGVGFATIAVRGMLEWAFAQPSVTRVTDNTTDDNPASVRVMERAGMTISHGPGGLVRGVAMREFWHPPRADRPDGPGAGD
jgi:RimJ/RimL family protein N-acetyltransferase